MKEYKAILCAEEVPGILAKGCQDPTCTDHSGHMELVLAARCHPGKGMVVTVVSPSLTPIDRPVVRFECRVCGKFVGSVLVGRENEAEEVPITTQG